MYFVSMILPLQVRRYSMRHPFADMGYYTLLQNRDIYQIYKEN